MFYTDKPISSDNQDLLNRGNFAKLLAKSLINLNNNDTFSVGLFGEWGSGKTSLVNMMLNEIESLQTSIDEKDRLIIVHFDPWNFSTEEQLLSQFFIRLSNEFRSKKDKRLAKIGEALEVYSEAFDIAKAIPKVGNVLSFFGKKSTLALSKKMKNGFDEKDILKQKEYVINLLEKQPNKILIVIDDIDRLSNQQIRQVFQLITSVAKFPNTIYLLAFDKKVVVKALEKIQEGKGEDYLEKVIQMPIEVPNIQKKELHQILFNNFDDIISKNNNILFSKEHWQTLFEPCVSPFIKNLRDVNRLCNLVQFKLAALESEADFTDVVSISVAEIYLPTIYDWIKENKSILTGEQDMSTLCIKDKTQNDWYEFYRLQIDSLLTNDKTLQSENDVDKVIVFLSYLFPYFGHRVGKTYETYDRNKLRKNNQIGHPDKFDRYFHLNSDDITLKKSEILYNVQFSNKDELITFMLEQEKKETAYEFLEEIQAMLSNISLERTLCLLDALIESSNFFVSSSSNSIFGSRTSDYAEFLILDLIEKLEENKRLPYILGVLNSADLNSLKVLGDVINMIELGYGRLAANGTQRNYKKVITVEELVELEKIYCDKVKLILKSENLFCIDGWKRIFYLLECFEPDYINVYLSNSFKEDKNILSFLAGEVAIWSGSGISYEIGEDYKKYLNTEVILTAIDTQRKNGELFLMSKRVQNCCGAFYLNSIGKRNFEGDISQSDVDALLDSWKNE